MPWRKLQPTFPHWLMAAILETYYGGRTECLIRRIPVVGVYLDFVSQYPTSFVLQELWPYVIGRGIRWKEEQTEFVQRLLDVVTVHQVLRREFWKGLHVLVLVQPYGDRLPSRARYGGRTSPWNVAVSLRTGGPSQWWTLADCVASKLHTGKAPVVIRVMRLSPRPPQEGLVPIDIAGNPEYRVDPYRHDPIRRLVELRAAIKAEDAAESAGDLSRSQELNAIQDGMKIAANAIAYGIGIEVNVAEHRRPVWATVHRSDGTSYRNRFKRTERVGVFFHPLVATLVSSGGRLLLAAAMTLLEEQGGTYSLCDTDSLFVPATRDGLVQAGDAAEIRSLSWDQVHGVVEAFERLNPYRLDLVPGSILQMENENFDPETGEQREIEAFSIASKRYAMFTRESDGQIRIIGTEGKRKRSEHGLGHLLPPEDPDPRSEDRSWIDRWWESILAIELGADGTEPPWLDLPAAGRLPVSSRREEATFRSYNGSRLYVDRVRPFNFLMVFHAHRAVRGFRDGPRSVVAPFESDRTLWEQAECFDRGDPSSRVYRIQTTDPYTVLPGRIPVQTYRDYFQEYRVHPESKLAGADGKACHSWTKGELRARHIVASEIVRIGKESSRLTEDVLSAEDSEDGVVEYRQPRTCGYCGKALTDPRQRYCNAAHKQRAYRKRLALGRRLGH